MAQTGKVKWHGKAVERAVRTAAARGVQLWAEHVLTESRAKVPHDEGTLERSGAVVPSRVSPSTLDAAIVYDTPYAVIQHENMDFRHPGGREAKYLENALNAAKTVGPKIVATQIKRALQ
jgi:hypothetical protein